MIYNQTLPSGCGRSHADIVEQGGQLPPSMPAPLLGTAPPSFPATSHSLGVAAARNPALFGGFGRRRRAEVAQGAQGFAGKKAAEGNAQQDGVPMLFGGAANLNGEVGALLPRLCVRKAELRSRDGLDWLQARARGAT